MPADRSEYDWIVIGSGFGGSVCALRLVEKGYRVLMLERGRRFRPEDFPRSNWQLRRWLWLPGLGCRGPFRISLFRHLTVFSGVGVGGGSLVYACTLPRPPASFFHAPSWAELGVDWERELAPHYHTAEAMLGATEVPLRTPPDEALREMAEERGRPEDWSPTRVGIHFGEEGEWIPDPYFGGEGPPRQGCRSCGGCMLGCRHEAKNGLDRNYLWLAERRGLEILAETEAVHVGMLADGWARVRARERRGALRPRRHREWRARRVVFAGGVLGTVPLLQRLRRDPHGLPALSPRVGDFVLSNAESLLAVTRPGPGEDLSRGVAIGSILRLDSETTLEPVRYPAGSGFFRLMMAPWSPGPQLWRRQLGALGKIVRHPWRWLRVFLVRDWARQSAVLLFMRTREEALRLQPGHLPRPAILGGRLRSRRPRGAASLRVETPESTRAIEDVARRLRGEPVVLVSESLMGNPSTAHLLGGCRMSRGPEEGVIDSAHRLHGYPSLFVVDGSALSANPGVNPALTITALAERAMSLVPSAEGAHPR